MINLMANFPDVEMNLGIVEITTARADAVSLRELIFYHLAKFGIISTDVLYLIADGAAVNSKLAKLCGIPIQRCQNHAIQLAIVDTFYKKIAQEANIDAINDFDDSSDEDDEMYIDPDSSPRAMMETQFKIADELDSDYATLIHKVRKVSVSFHSPKRRRFLSAYTSLITVIDCKTRWSSMFSMVSRFLEIIVPLRKASWDAGLEFEFTSEMVDKLKDLASVLKIAFELIKTLSHTNANLITADLAVSEKIVELSALETTIADTFKKNLINRFAERRNETSDFLAFLMSHELSTESNLFYTRPDMQNMKEFYQKHFVKLDSVESDQSSRSVPLQSNAVAQSMNITLNSQNVGMNVLLKIWFHHLSQRAFCQMNF